MGGEKKEGVSMDDAACIGRQRVRVPTVRMTGWTWTFGGRVGKKERVKHNKCRPFVTAPRIKGRLRRRLA